MRIGVLAQRVVPLTGVLFIGLLMLFAARAPFTASFWLDETISAWIVRGSFDDVVRRSMIYQGQSPFYYLLLLGTSILVGTEEVAMRSGSILLGLVGLWQVYRLATLLSGQREAGIVAAGALLCMNPFQDALLSARPYALSFVCALASVISLHRLLERFSYREAFLFTLSCVATFYAHYLFSVIFVVHCMFILSTKGLFKRLLPWIVGGACACAPMIPQLLSLLSRRSGLMFAHFPNLAGFINGTAPVPVLASVLLSLALALVWGGTMVIEPRCKRGFRFLVPYIVTPIVVFALWSLGGSGSMWVTRYWGWQAAMWAAFLGMCVATVRGDRARLIVVCSVFGFFALRLGTQVRILEDWRGAAAAVRSSQGVIGLYSGLVEVESNSGAQQTEYREYVRAPLSVYGVTAPIETLSFSRMEEDIARIKGEAGSFVIFNRLVDGESTVGIAREIIAKEGLKLAERPQGSLITVLTAVR